MKRFFREWSIDKISDKLAAELAEKYSQRPDMDFLGNHIRILRSKDVDYHTKIYFINSTIALVGMEEAKALHHRFFSFYVNNVRRKEEKRIHGMLDALMKVNEDYITNACDSIAVRSAQESSYYGQMGLRLCYGDGILRFDVEDNGTGIHSDIESTLFVKMQNSRKRKSPQGGIQNGGMGMALYQTREIIEGLGGKVGFENKGVNKGARFWYEIPIDTLRR